MSKARQNASAFADITAVVGSFPAAISGLTLARESATTFSVAPGMAANSSGTPSSVLLSRNAAITKSLSAFAAGGAGAGALDTGTIASNTWYHVFLVRRDSDGRIDVLLSASATAPTMPTGWTGFRRIGSILTDGSSQIVPFVQIGDRFMWDTPVNDLNATNPGTAAVNATLSIPTGVRVFPICGWLVKNVTTPSIDLLVSAVEGANIAPTSLINTVAAEANSATARAGVVLSTVLSNTSGRVRYRLSASGASDVVQCTTFGWIDMRGA